MQNHTAPAIIYDTLHLEILNLTIKPGQAVVEADVCLRFNASRTPVRTAFQRLADAGLLEIVPYKGAFATLLDFDYIQQMIYLRQAVEAQVLGELIARPDPYVVEKIRYSLRCQNILLSTQFSADEFYAMDSDMHRLWFRHAGKERLWQTIQDFEVHYTRFRMLDIVAVQSYRHIVREHEALLSCIEASDRVGASRILDEHLNGGIARLGTRIREEFSAYFVRM